MSFWAGVVILVAVVLYVLWDERRIGRDQARETRPKALRSRYEREPVARALGDGDLEWAEIEALWTLEARR